MSIDSNRVQDIIRRIGAMTAADMKMVAKFGKVKNYSQEYLDLKESLRMAFVAAQNVHGVDLLEEFNDIEPITFTGMIPNDHFNIERRKIVHIGERLAERLTFSGVGQAANGAQVSAPAGSAATVAAAPRIFVSGDTSAITVSDLSRCLATADCEIAESQAAGTAAESYSLMPVIDQMRRCSGAMLCLMDPSDLTGDEDADYGRRNDIAKKVIVELGVALGRYPERTYFVVQDTMLEHLPEALMKFVSFRATGDQLSFEEGQRAVLAFKRSNWAND